MANMDNNFPKILDITEDENIIFDAIRTDEKITEKHLKNITINGADLTALAFAECILEKCKFIDCKLHKVSFANTIIKNCDFSNSDALDTYFSNCRIDTSKFMGTVITGAIWKYVSVFDSNFVYANLDLTKFSDVDIERCDFTTADMNECRIKNTNLTDVNFTECGFFKTRLADIDFSTCIIDGIRVSTDKSELSGMTVNVYQAVDLSKLLGIIIKE